MPLYLAIVFTSFKSGFEAFLAAFLTTFLELDMNVCRYIWHKIELILSSSTIDKELKIFEFKITTNFEVLIVNFEFISDTFVNFEGFFRDFLRVYFRDFVPSADSVTIASTVLVQFKGNKVLFSR